MKTKLFLNNFVLKIIALITMTIDHVGMFLNNPYYFSPNDVLFQIGFVFRIIGRIACPLYCFMLVEGALHTKNWKKYALRLGVMLLAILIVQIVMDYGFNSPINAGNIFIDLFLGLLMIVSFENKKKTIKLLGFLPILYAIVSFVCYGIEYSSAGKITIFWFPYFIRCQYYFFSIFFIAAVYGCYKLLPRIYTWYGFNSELYKDEEKYHFFQNLLAAGCLIIFTAFGYLFKYSSMNLWNYNVQSYMILALLPILFYNGKRGYNAKWFQYFNYLYYPVHMIIIWLIFLI